MAKLVYGLNQSLDGYVDHMKLGPPGCAAFPHFIELVRGLSGPTSMVAACAKSHALLGRRAFLIGTRGTRGIRGGVAKPAEVGRVAVAQVSWSQRHAGRG